MNSKRGAFTQHLIEEHKIIRSLLDVLGKQEVRELKTLIPILKFFIEDLHHKKEEELLFPALLESAPLQQGGPRCSFFFGLRLEDYGSQKLPQKLPELRPITKYILDSKSPLSIPVEEHIAGHLALELLGELQDDRVLANSISHYLHLMDLHIRKEDECLFVLADNYLSPEIQNKLLDRALEINKVLDVASYDSIIHSFLK